MTAPRTTAPALGFTADLWDTASPIFEAILEHAFLRGLTDGSLPEERFRFYIKQDSLYLREYARCLALASAREVARASEDPTYWPNLHRTVASAATQSGPRD